MIEEVNRNLHLIKSFGLKIPLNFPIKTKRQISFSDFSVAIQSNSGSISLLETKKFEGILVKKTSGIGSY